MLAIEEIDPLTRLAMACPAMPLCGLAITEAERAMPSFIERMRALLIKVRRTSRAAARRALTPRPLYGPCSIRSFHNYYSTLQPLQRACLPLGFCSALCARALH